MAINRILFVTANCSELNMPVHAAGMYQVAEAASQAGYEVRVADTMGRDDPFGFLQEEVMGFRPDCIGLSVRNIDDQDIQARQFLLDQSLEVVRFVRTMTAAPVIVGGAGFSIFPQSVLEYLQADMGLAGEGEQAFVRLLEALNGEERLDEVPGICLPGRGLLSPPSRVRELDGCPLPRPERVRPDLASRSDFWMPYQTRRGCPLDCSYCSTGTIEGRQVRKRSLHQVAENLKAFYASGIRRFFMVDNTFNLPRGYAEAFCQTIIASGLDISWRCIVYPKHCDRSLARLMAEAGCSDVALGFESGSPEVLRALNKRFSPDEVRRASDGLAEAGIKRVGFLLLGGPGETEATVRESLGFAESLELEALKITVGIRIYPGTAVARRAREKGLVDPGDSLLQPSFYLEPELAEWLPEFIETWSAERPNLVLP